MRGHRVGPARQLHANSAKATTLSLHGLGFGEFYWNVQGNKDDEAMDARRTATSWSS